MHFCMIFLFVLLFVRTECCPYVFENVKQKTLKGFWLVYIIHYLFGCNFVSWTICCFVLIHESLVFVLVFSQKCGMFVCLCPSVFFFCDNLLD